MNCKVCGNTGINPYTRDWCTCPTGRACGERARRESEVEQRKAQAGLPTFRPLAENPEKQENEK